METNKQTGLNLLLDVFGVISVSIKSRKIRWYHGLGSSFGYGLFIWRNMNDLENVFWWGIGVFIVVFLVNYFLIYNYGYNSIKKQKKKKRQKKIEEYIGFSYIIPKFNLDINKMNLNISFLLLSLINAFIIGLVFVIIYLIPWSLSFRMLLGFVLLFGLIYSLYEILGKIFVKKGWKKDV